MFLEIMFLVGMKSGRNDSARFIPVRIYKLNSVREAVAWDGESSLARARLYCYHNPSSLFHCDFLLLLHCGPN